MLDIIIIKRNIISNIKYNYSILNNKLLYYLLLYNKLLLYLFEIFI